MEDTISRKAAIDAIRDADVCVQWNGIISDEDAVDITVKATKRSLIYSVKKLPSAQPETHDKRTKTHSCDLIDRQAVIDAFYKHPNIDWTTLDVLAKINALPSAQPETHDKRTETHACDLIDRQAAIDAHYEYCNKHPDAGFPVWSLKILEDLPSAQPEIVRCKDCMYWVAHDKRCVYLNHGFAPGMWCCHGRRTDEV